MPATNVISLLLWGSLVVFNRSTEKLEKSHRTEDNSLKSKARIRLLGFITPKYNLVREAAAELRMGARWRHTHTGTRGWPCAMSSLSAARTCVAVKVKLTEKCALVSPQISLLCTLSLF